MGGWVGMQIHARFSDALVGFAGYRNYESQFSHPPPPPPLPMLSLWYFGLKEFEPRSWSILPEAEEELYAEIEEDEGRVQEPIKFANATQTQPKQQTGGAHEWDDSCLEEAMVGFRN